MVSQVACGGRPETALRPVPRPDLSRVEEAVRRQLEERAAGLADLGDVAPEELAEAYGELGRLYHAYDFAEAAEACYRNARGLADDAGRWTYYLAFLLRTRGALEPAAELFAEVVEKRPEDLPALLRLADVLLELERPGAARGLLEKALALDPDAAAAHYGLGRIAAREGDWAAAVERFERTLELQPGADLVHYALGQAWHELGEDARAADHLARRGTAGPEFADPLIRTLDELAVGSGLRLTRGGVALAEGREDAAVEELRRAVTENPRQLSARLDLGRLLDRAGDTGGARRELEEAVRIAPRSALAHDALGTLLARDGDDAGAIEHLRCAVELEERFADAHLRLGTVLARARRHQEAVVAYSKVLELDPRNVDALLARGTSRLDLGDLAAAREDLAALSSYDPDHALAHLRLGEALQRLGDDGALAAFSRALELGLEDDERAAAHLSLGNLLLARGGDDATALGHYRAALAVAPELVPARYNLAGLLSRHGRLAEAAEHYRTVLGRQPDHEAARRYLAEALAALGRHREALRQLEDGLAVRPDSVVLAHALARTLASSSERGLRDGDRALELALAVFQADRSLEHAETLAMAFAEAGHFAEAVRWQTELLATVEGTGDERSAARLRQNLELYRTSTSCCAG